MKEKRFNANVKTLLLPTKLRNWSLCWPLRRKKQGNQRRSSKAVLVGRAISLKRVCISNALTSKIFITSRLIRNTLKRNQPDSVNKYSCYRRATNSFRHTAINQNKPQRQQGTKWRLCRSKTKVCVSLLRPNNSKSIALNHPNSCWNRKNAFQSKRNKD